MNINKFCVSITKREGKKKQIDIAQIKEILRIVNDLTNGILYRVIKFI